MLPFFRKDSAHSHSHAHVEFEIVIESSDDETDAGVAAVAIEVRRLPFMIGRIKGSTAGHRIGTDFFLIDDPKPHNVSRDHCSLEVIHGKLVVRDRSSTLGTQVNGQAIGQRFAAMDAELREGENTLLLGTSHSPHRFRVVVIRRG